MTKAEVGVIIKKGVTSQGIWEASRSWKRQESRSPLEPAEEASLLTPDFSPRRIFGLPTSRTVGESMCRFMPQICGDLSQQQLETDTPAP